MNKQRSQFVIATVLIVLGVVFLLGNLDIINVDIGDLLSNWWPLILILLGVIGLFQARGTPVGSIVPHRHRRRASVGNARRSRL